MYRYKDVRLRKFKFEDIPLKIKWVNNVANNQYLHYDLPLEYEKTCKWFESVKDKEDRFDAVIECDGKPVGLIGILKIDKKNKKGEDYILVDASAKGKGIATKAGILNMAYAFFVLELNKLCGYVEVGNMASVRQAQKRGGHIEGYLRADAYRDGKPIDNYAVGYYRENFSLPSEVYWEND